MKNKSSKNKYRIKYDKHSMSIVKKAAIVFTIMFMIGIALTFVEIQGAELVWLFSLYIGGGVSVACYVALFCSAAYFSRLEKYGYVIPENRNDYDNRLENLPKKPRKRSMKEKSSVEVLDGQNESDTLKAIADDEDKISLCSNHSKILSYISLFIFVIFLIMDIRYYVYWKCQGESTKSLFVLCLLFYMVWIFLAIFTIVQSNPKKYRDDVEIDDTRKERTNIEQGIFVYIVFFLLSLFANATANSMTNYMFQSEISRDMEQARMYQEIFENAINEYKDEKSNLNYNEWENTYEQLVKGVDITTWGCPSDSLQQSIADSLVVEDFSYLKGDFKSADGDAQIFVQYISDSGNIVVKLLNPKKEVAKRSNKYKEIVAQ